jgi:hypothetical protein
MKSIKLKKMEHTVLDGVVLPVEEMEESLVIIRVDNQSEVEAVQDALECADALQDLKHASFLIVTGDLDVDIVKNGGSTIAAVTAGIGLTQMMHDEEDEEVPF